MIPTAQSEKKGYKNQLLLQPIFDPQLTSKFQGNWMLPSTSGSLGVSQETHRLMTKLECLHLEHQNVERSHVSSQPLKQIQKD